MERSSSGVREDANMDLSTAGVTGIFPCESSGPGESPRRWLSEGADDIGGV